MSEPENFLSRWSRKKRDAAEEAAPRPPEPTPPVDARPPAADAANVPAEKNAGTSAPGKEAAEPTAFDPASLPSIDSIDAQTDVTGFLKPGVPPDLTRAALRRAWTADPAIRDFKGLAENDWDFNEPNAMMGFGPLGPDVDVKRMLASLFGETPKEEAAVAETGAHRASDDAAAPAIDATKPAGEIAAPDSADVSGGIAVDDRAPSKVSAVRVGPSGQPDDVLVQRNTDIASQNSESETTRERPTGLAKPPRSHGGALPR